MKNKILSMLKLIIVNSFVFIFLIIILEFISRKRDNWLLVDINKQQEKIRNYQNKLNIRRNIYGDSLIPLIVPSVFYHDTLIPLGSISHFYTQFPNENGSYPVYKNDRYGFNNNDQNYNNSIDAVLIGDSFVHGCCVNQNENISSNLTSMGLNSINLGAADNSVLSELATYVEYADKLNPKTIIWFYYEGNDFDGIPIEYTSKVLSKYYVDSHFNQNLINRQKQINNFILKNYKKKNNSLVLRLKKLSLYKRLKYHYVRLSSLNDQKSKKVFFDVIKRISQDCILKNRKFIFVYLPSWDRYYEKDIFNNRMLKKDVLNFLKINRIKYYDFSKKLVENNSEPKDFFSIPRGHYNSIGYKKLSEEIFRIIKN